MTRTKQGYECPKCRTVTQDICEVRREPRSREPPNHIYIFEEKEENLTRVTQECPKCGNKEAYRWFTAISGEHAGISRETTIEHYRCTRCSHTWTETS
jgi:DNA-directed RNA polymerase subunit M/transcription elongation factor TFIIS